jgi:hypothetical protein
MITPVGSRRPFQHGSGGIRRAFHAPTAAIIDSTPRMLSVRRKL